MAYEKDEDGVYHAPPIHGWYGMTRSAYLVLPRLALEAMSHEWQRRFIALMEEVDETGIQTPDYHVLRAEPSYTSVELNDPDDDSSWPREFYILQSDEWANYRHGDVSTLCPEFKVPK